MDISATTAPKSDQQNFDDYISGPKTVTISDVRAGSDEQPVEIHLVEFPGRPYKPSKSMRRVLVAAWGPDASTYAGRKLTLFGDPTVKFGGAVTGGIKISHASHLEKTLNISLTATRGKRAPHTVKPLEDAPAPAPAPSDRLPRLFDLMSAAGFSKEEGRAYLSRVVGREVSAAKELTPDEVEDVIEALELTPEAPPADEAPAELWPEAAKPADA